MSVVALRRLRHAGGALIVLCGVACATTPSDRGVSGERAPAAPETRAEPEMPTAIARGTRTQTALIPLGAVPFDDFTLPLLHPTERLVATQIGIAPLWSTALAEPGAPVPEATTIEIRALTPGEPSRLVHRLPGPVLLGRSADVDGFLVEQPLPDGARRIGFCGWRSGEITWLVDDGRVNAHATLGPGRRLAWSRRALDADRFDLAVLDERGEQVLRAEDDETWLMPEWSADGRMLFALRLRDGVLQAAAMMPSDPVTMRQSLRTLTLTNRGTTRIAYQTLAPRFGAGVDPGVSRDSWILFHPTEARMVLWSAREGRVRTFRPRSISVALIDADRAVVALNDAVVIERLADGSVSPTLIQGPHAVRSVRQQAWPVVLLRPDDGGVSITGLIPLRTEGGP